MNTYYLGALLVLFLCAPVAGHAQTCNPADAKMISAAQKKVDALERKLVTAKADDKAAAQKQVDEAKAELAKLECKDPSSQNSGAASCKPADAKAINSAQKKVEAAEKKLATSQPADKAAAQEHLDEARAELARLECKDPASQNSGAGTAGSGTAGCKPGDAKAVNAARQKVEAAERKLAAAKPEEKAGDEMRVHEAKAELAKLECKDPASQGSGAASCKPADAKAISSAQKKVEAAEKKLAAAQPADKASLEKQVDDAKAELAKLECK